jgi:23S rRNA pseudouridine1911/1915/1917 synthase
VSRERFVVDATDVGLRLDQVLAKRIAGLSRRKARVLLELGGVFVDRARVKVASRPVRPGQEIEVHIGGVLDRASGEVGAAARARDAALLPDYAVLFEDDDLVVVDKPAGLITAPTPESDRGNLADLLARRPPPHGGAIHVVHRLDRPTSGVLVLARSELANRVLSDAFAAHTIEREYRAVAVGTIDAAQTIDRPIESRRAVTHIAPLEALRDATLLACRLDTGRSHQIRIHLTSIGHPIAGDSQHGADLSRNVMPRPPRLALHAAILAFPHPRTAAPLRFESPLPPDLATWLAAMR